MARMVKVLDDAARLFEAATTVDPLDGGEVRADDVLGRVDNSLQFLPLLGAQVAVPSHDATGQHALNCAPIEVRESPPRHTDSP